MNAASAPFFVIGNPRSGTTMLRLLLNSHPSLVVPPECGFAVWWYEKYKAAQFDGSDAHQKLGQFLDDLLTSKKIETWHLDADRLRLRLNEERPNTYPDVISVVYRSFAGLKGKDNARWGDKNNFYIAHIATLAEMFPAAKFVFIVRDGRDVAASYIELSKRTFDSPYAPHLPTDVARIANEWKGNNSAALSSFGLLPKDAWLQVRYEDIVSDPGPLLSRLCDFLDVPFHPGMLDFHQHSREEEPNDFLAWKGKVTERVSPDSIGRYKTVLTDVQVKAFEEVAGTMLRSFQYHMQ